MESLIQDPAMTPVAPTSIVEVCERDLDFLFAEEIECELGFRSWFFEQTGGYAEAAVIRVCRSVATTHGETDLLVVQALPAGGRRALMVENKIAAPFTPLQAKRYRMRGEEGVRNGDWTEFATVLVCPAKRLDGVPPGLFDYCVTYEECRSAIVGGEPRSAFKRRILDSAIGKARKPWVANVDQVKSAWYVQARSFAARRFPDLPFPVETAGRSSSNDWMTFFAKQFPQARVSIELKFRSGNVDLRLAGVGLGDMRRAFGQNLPVGAVTDQASTGKSCHIRLYRTPPDLNLPVAGQDDTLASLFEAAFQLHEFAKSHHDLIMNLLGYEGTGLGSG